MNPYLPHHKFQEKTKLTAEHLFEVHSIEEKMELQMDQNIETEIKRKSKGSHQNPSCHWLRTATGYPCTQSKFIVFLVCASQFVSLDFANKTEWKANCGHVEKDLVWLGFPAKIGSMTNQQGSKAATPSAEESVKSFPQPFNKYL